MLLSSKITTISIKNFTKAYISDLISDLLGKGQVRPTSFTGAHCMHMHEVYGEFSSIIRQIPSLPRGQAGTDNVTVLLSTQSL